MAKYSDSMDVTVTVDKNAAGQYEISKIGKLDFDNKGCGVHKGGSWFIMFTVKNKHGADYRFPAKDDAFWVEVGNCSNPPKQQQLPYCMATWVSDDGSQLLVRNDNPSIETLKYTLNLVSSVSTPTSLQLDPIMGNQNGGVTFSAWSVEPSTGGWALAAGLLAGAALLGAALIGRERD